MDNDHDRTIKGHYARQLTESEAAKLERDTTLLSEFKRNKLETDAQKNWDLFYKRNETRFFKDRHWTKREFEELVTETPEGTGERQVLLEVGCGVGNFIFPLLEEKTRFYIYACDFSPRAVQMVKSHPLYAEEQVRAFQCDLTRDPLGEHVPIESVDVVTLIFVLSAIHPEKMRQVLDNVRSVLKPGGLVLFRDYGLYDQAMLRFSPGHKLAEGFYVRQDGTRAFYFSEEGLEQLFVKSGFVVEANGYVCRETVNRKHGICVPRVFLQGKFRKAHTQLQDTQRH